MSTAQHAHVQLFKAAKDTHRFRSNQKVWIRFRHANHLTIWFKWRGKGRYVGGTIDKFAKSVGEIKTIHVSPEFARKVHAGILTDDTELDAYSDSLARICEACTP